MSNNSDLVLKDIRVKRFEFDINEVVPFEGDQMINLSMNPTPNISKNSIHEGALELKMTLFDKDYQAKQNPFYLEIVVQGIFEDEDKGEVDLMSKYFPNMLSMLYSYFRTYISSVTGMFGMQSINIPTINVFKYLESNFDNNND